MPRRTSGMRMLRALNAEAGQLAKLGPTPTPPAPPAAPTKQGFDLDSHQLGVRATKLAIQMRGTHYVTTARGRTFVQKIADHIEAEELLEVAKLRDKYKRNELPTYAERMRRLESK